MSDTILLVDDNEDDIFAFKWALKKASIGHPVQVLTDGKQAIDYLSGAGQYSDRSVCPLPFLLFLDLKLPLLSGHEVLRWMGEHHELDSIQVIVLSGSDELRDHEQLRTGRPYSYMVKPLLPDQLASLISQTAQG